MKNPAIDTYLSTLRQWREETEKLRSIALACGLTEEVKWGKPAYTYNGGNVGLINGFKTNCVFSFFRGALLKDPEGILEQAGPNTRSARVVRFTDLAEIVAREPVLRAYMLEAIEVEKAGLRVDMQRAPPPPYPAELTAKLDESPALRAAFEALTPGRRRGYLLHFAGAKRSETRTARIERWAPKIMAGRGMDDR